GKTPQGQDRYCNKSGANMPRDRLIALFILIKEEMTRRTRPVVEPSLGPLAERVHELLRAQMELITDTGHGYYVHPSIPPRKVGGATKGCALPPDEKILALIDC